MPAKNSALKKGETAFLDVAQLLPSTPILNNIGDPLHPTKDKLAKIEVILFKKIIPLLEKPKGHTTFLTKHKLQEGHNSFPFTEYHLISRLAKDLEKQLPHCSEEEIEELDDHTDSLLYDLCQIITDLKEYQKYQATQHPGTATR